jgi:hypothetical protein
MGTCAASISMHLALMLKSLSRYITERVPLSSKMRPFLPLCVLAFLLEAAFCATIFGKLSGDRRVFIEVDISPTTFSDAFVTLHVDGQRVGVLCPGFYSTDCAAASAGDSRASVSSTHLTVVTHVPADAWNEAPHRLYASVETHFGRHIAFASGSVLLPGSSVGASHTSTSHATSNHEVSDNSKIMNIVIFSKDRPSQLDLLTRSLKRCVYVPIDCRCVCVLSHVFSYRALCTATSNLSLRKT